MQVRQTNANLTVVFRDPFPVFGVSGSQTAAIGAGLRPREVTASAWPLPSRPTYRELADQDYSAGRNREALENIGAARRERRLSLAEEAELTYKEALCLQASNRGEDAEQLFRSVAALDTAEQWPAMAAVQLGEIYRFKDLSKARSAYARLCQVSEGVRLPEFISHQTQLAIFSAYNPLLWPPSLIRPNPDRVHQLHELEMICRRCDAAPGYQDNVRQMLVTAYFRDGQLTEALARAEALRESPYLTAGVRRTVTDDLVWMLSLARADQQGEADAVTRSLEASADRADRLLAALQQARQAGRANRWADVEKHLAAFDRYREEWRPDPEADGWFLDACLLRGFAREAQGDEAGKEAAWRQGYEFWHGTSYHANISGAILGSLTNRLTDHEAWTMTLTVLGQLAADRDQAVSRLLQQGMFLSKESGKLLRAMWNTERGRKLARRVVLRDLAYLDWAGAQVKLSIAAIVQIYCLDGVSLGAELEREVWTFCEQSFDLYQAGVLPEGVVQSLTSWLFFGERLEFPLKGVKDELPRSYMARLLLITGHRQRALGPARHPDARESFRRSAELANESPAVRSLAQSAIRALSAPP